MESFGDGMMESLGNGSLEPGDDEVVDWGSISEVMVPDSE